MPIYEYQCEQCGHRSEEMRRLSDPPLTVCPSCGGPYKKLISAPAFQFKGSGWYVTDYGKGGAKGAAETSTPKSDGAASGGDAGGSGAKPEGGAASPAASTPSPAKAEKPAGS